MVERQPAPGYAPGMPYTASQPTAAPQPAQHPWMLPESGPSHPIVRSPGYVGVLPKSDLERALDQSGSALQGFRAEIHNRCVEIDGEIHAVGERVVAPMNHVLVTVGRYAATHARGMRGALHALSEATTTVDALASVMAPETPEKSPSPGEVEQLQQRAAGFIGEMDLVYRWVGQLNSLHESSGKGLLQRELMLFMMAHSLRARAGVLQGALGQKKESLLRVGGQIDEVEGQLGELQADRARVEQALRSLSGEQERLKHELPTMSARLEAERRTQANFQHSLQSGRLTPQQLMEMFGPNPEATLGIRDTQLAIRQEEYDRAVQRRATIPTELGQFSQEHAGIWTGAKNLLHTTIRVNIGDVLGDIVTNLYQQDYRERDDLFEWVPKVTEPLRSGARIEVDFSKIGSPVEGYDPGVANVPPVYSAPPVRGFAKIRQLLTGRSG
jgi:hypothetical protein